MSAKTSTQPGRRTPLSLSGTVTKGQPTKSVNAANGSGGGNANGQNSSNNNKQDNKQQQQQKTEQQQQQKPVNNTDDKKENPNKKQLPAEKKQQQQQNDNKKSGSEKTQNGVTNKQQQQTNDNKQQQATGNKQQQQPNKEKQQNGNDGKSNEKDKKEKSEKQDKPEKEETKTKEEKKDQEKLDSEKEDKKVKEDKKEVENKKVKENKKEIENKKDEKEEKEAEKTVEEETKLKDTAENKIADTKQEENVEKMEVVPEEQQQQEQKSPPVTPKANNRGNKTSTPSSKTPTKVSEKTPQKSVTPSSNSAKTTPVVTREVTTAIDDVEMEPLAVEQSPIKSSQSGEVATLNIAPSATSTPGKIILPKRNTAVPKSDVQLAMLTGLSPERPRAFSQISGRKSIRPITDYTPSKFQSNSQFRESYRRINTELDATNTSLNVTVGSEVPNNLSFSFFGRGRKRDRTPPQISQSAIGELQTDLEISPPKRARYDMHGFFSVVSSPLSLLRNRFSKATLQSSTPVKLEEKLNSSEDEIEVQNVSGVSVHEEINKTDKESGNDATLGVEAEETNDVTPVKGELELEDKEELKDVSLQSEKTCVMEQQTSEQSEIKITETPLQPVVGDPMAKNKRCIVM